MPFCFELAATMHPSLTILLSCGKEVHPTITSTFIGQIGI